MKNKLIKICISLLFCTIISSFVDNSFINSFVYASENTVFNFIYYDRELVSNDTTIGLWHFDNDYLDSSLYVNDFSVVTDGAPVFSNSIFSNGYTTPSISSDDVKNFTNIKDNYSISTCLDGDFLTDDYVTVEFYLTVPDTLDCGRLVYRNYDNIDYDFSEYYVFSYSYPTDYNSIVHRYFSLDPGIYHIAIVYRYSTSASYVYVNGSYNNSCTDYHSEYLSSSTYFYNDYKSNLYFCDDYIDINLGNGYGESHLNESSGFIGYDANYYVFASGVTIDELRVSNSRIYSGNFNVPSEPFDSTSSVVTSLPAVSSDYTFAIDTADTISDFSVGTTVPISPIDGEVYVSIDENYNVDGVYQYCDLTWDNKTSSICYDGAWVDSIGYDLTNVLYIDEGETDPTEGETDPAEGETGSTEGETSSTEGETSSADATGESFLSFTLLILDFFKIPITVFGFTFNYWQITLFCLLFSAVAKFFISIFDL